MSPRVEELRIDVRRRYRRTVFGMVFLGFATVVLGAAVGWAIATNFSQDDQIQTFSACAERPNSAECIKGHANSVALTTYAEACFILAQAGRRCGPRPLPEAGAYHQNLLLSIGPDVDEISYGAIPPAGSAPDRPASSVPPSSEPVSPAVPRPLRAPTEPSP